MAKKADSKETKSAAKAESKKGADKKDAKAKGSSKKDAKKGGIKKYFRDLKSEIKKVVWPSREKVTNNTGVVLGVIVACGLALFGIDNLLALAVNALLSIGA